MRGITKFTLSFATLFLFAISVNAQGVSISIKNPRDALPAFSPGALADVHGRLINSPLLAKELKLTNEQRDDLEKKRIVLRDIQRELFPAPQPSAPRTIPTPEQQAEGNKKHEKLRAETKKHVESVLNEQQKKRLGEIHLQLLGIVAFANKDLLNDLKLSKDQIEKIESIMDDCGSEIMKNEQELLRTPFNQERSQKMLDFRAKSMKEHLVKVEAILNDDQKNSWSAMKGKESDAGKLQQEAEERQKKAMESRQKKK